MHEEPHYTLRPLGFQDLASRNASRKTRVLKRLLWGFAHGRIPFEGQFSNVQRKTWSDRLRRT